jgi:hypothetical protein
MMLYGCGWRLTAEVEWLGRMTLRPQVKWTSHDNKWRNIDAIQKNFWDNKTTHCDNERDVIYYKLRHVELNQPSILASCDKNKDIQSCGSLQKTMMDGH